MPFILSDISVILTKQSPSRSPQSTPPHTINLNDEKENQAFPAPLSPKTERLNILAEQVTKLHQHNTALEDTLNQLKKAFLERHQQMEPKPAVTETPEVVDESLIKKAIVQVKSHTKGYDEALPWLPEQPEYILTGSGFVIDKNKRWLLTNAHVVQSHQHLSILAADSNEYTAEVLAIDNNIDLALMIVKDDKFWDKAKTLEFDDAFIRDKKTVVIAGFPLGGKSVGVSQGESARVESTIYADSGRAYLAIHITAPTNSGNSGGPALYKNRVIGVVHQTIPGAQGVNHVIPGFMVKKFLKHAALSIEQKIPYKSCFDPSIIRYQIIENADAKDFYGLTDEVLRKQFFERFPNAEQVNGIRVTSLPLHSVLKTYLKKNDILLSINNYPIHQDGYVSVEENLRILFKYLFHTELLGEEAEILVLRNKELLTYKVPTKDQGAGNDSLIQQFPRGKQPSYYCLNGFILQPVTSTHLRGNNSGLADAVRDFNADRSKKHDDEQKIILGKVMPCEYTKHYDYWSKNLFTEINGHKIDSMRSAIQAIEKNTGSYHVIKFGSSELILKNIAVKTQATLLKQLGIPELCSANLFEHSEHHKQIKKLTKSCPASPLLFSEKAANSAVGNASPILSSIIATSNATDEDFKESDLNNKNAALRK